MSHLPRVLSEPESAAEDIRNALAVIKAAADWGCVQSHAGDPLAVYEASDVKAVVERLESAARKLEARRG
jgi:hypothetical protein